MNDRPQPRPDDWAGAPMTKPVCPIHGTREVPRVQDRDGTGYIEYVCPVEGCEHRWVVKRVRI